MQTVILKRANRILTEGSEQGYRVISGRLQILLQPVSEEGPLRQMFLCEADAGSVIPFLDRSTIPGRSPVRLMLYISAVDDTVLEEIEITEDIRAAFYASLPVYAQYPNLYGEPEEKLFQIYQIREQERKDRINDLRSHSERRRERSADMIGSVFLKKEERRIRAIEYSGNPVYDAAACLCKIMRIPIVSYEKLQKACGKMISLDDIARLSGFVCREVSLEDGWQNRVTGPLLCSFGDSGEMCVCNPVRKGHFNIWKPSIGEISAAKPDELERFAPSAWVFYRPLKKDRINFWDITKLASREFSLSDVFFLLVCTLAATVLGLQLANLNAMLFDEIIPQGDQSMLRGVGAVYLTCMVSNLCFNLSKNLINYRIDSRVRYSLQAAIYDRVLHLPERFFGGKNSAEQAYQIQNLNAGYMRAYNEGFQIILQGGFSLMYMWKMHQYSSLLSHLGTVFIVLNIITTLGIGYLDRLTRRRKFRLTGRLRSFLYQALNGIEIVRAFGAEDDILFTYMKEASESGLADKRSANNRRVSSLLGTLTNALALIIMYDVYAQGFVGISGGSFMGFISAYSSFAAAMLMVANNGMDIVSMIPMLRDSSAFLKEAPERSGKGEILEQFKGDIQLSYVSFSYGKGQKTILEDISLHIMPGEYVGIVGETGCGKSTLLKLLLGFEKPTTGQIHYDGVTMERLSMPELRRQMGVVLQDGGLFSGSIYKNIRIACPSATSDQIHRAVEDAGLREVIDSMPMGIDTFVSEQGRTLSGGQKQRILIARAIVGSPKILFFDEATSSLDNVSQQKICESLEKYNATRLVIAHRLSTIEKCDRIIVLEKGKIAETGTYKELMDKQGAFYNLAKSQVLE